MELYTFNKGGFLESGMLRQIMLVMKVTTILVFAFLMQVSAAGLAQKITLNERNASLESVMDKIRSQTGYEFMFNVKDVDNAKKVNINIKGRELNEVLEVLFEDQALSFSIKDKFIVLKPKESSLLDRTKAVISNIVRDLTVRGKVVDQNGAPLPNASIRIKGKNTVINTNEKGEFSIANVADDAVLVISYVGYKSLEISLKDAKMPLEIKLDVATGELQEVDITYNTGYQKLKPNEVTGSITHITKEQLQRSVSPNILERINGIAQGVLFTKSGFTSGTFGNTPDIQIRGKFTLNMGGEQMSQPLIVLDNFPYSGNIQDIDPNNVESIDILKDAAAASIWGARAGNGVLVITTKQGKINQKPEFSFSSNLITTGKPNLKKSNLFISSSDYIDLETFLFNQGFFDAHIDDPIGNPLSPVVDILARIRNNTLNQQLGLKQIADLRNIDARDDYLKYIYRDELNQQYSVNLSGGGNKMTYAVSGSFNGIENGNKLKNNSTKRIALNSNTTYQPINQLKFNLGIGYISNDNRPNARSEYNRGDYNYGGSNGGRFLPYARLINENGDPAIFEYELKSSFKNNIGNGKLLDWNYSPLQELEMMDNHNVSSVINLNLGTVIDIMKGLHIGIDYNLQKTSGLLSSHYSKDSYFTRNIINLYTNITTNSIQYGVPNEGILDLTNIQSVGNNGRLSLNYNESWNDKHRISFFAGGDIASTTNDIHQERVYGYGELKSPMPVDYVTPKMTIFGYENLVPFINSFRTLTNRNIAYFGNISYTYRNRYTFSGSARKDAANLFGVKTNEKGKAFWSAGANWKIDSEPFYQIKEIPELNFRMTYGYSGNFNPAGVAKAIIRNGGIDPFTNLPFTIVDNYPNPYLRWERVGTFNTAIDFGLKGGRLRGSIEYWHKKSTDVFSSEDLDLTTGQSRKIINGANITGYGFDLNLQTKNFTFKSFEWSSSLNLAYVDYKITRYRDGNFNKIEIPTGNGYLREGYNPYSIGGRKWAGLDPKTGAPRGYLNGEISMDYDRLNTSEDIEIIGLSLAPYYGNFLNTFRYKGFSLSTNIIYKFGYYFKRPVASMSYYGMLFQMDNSYYQRWQKAGDEKITDIPSLQYPENNSSLSFYYNSEVHLERGDHILINDLTIDFILNRKMFKRLPFYLVNVGAQLGGLNWNLWKYSKYNPNNSTGIPNPLQLAFRLNVTL